MDPERQRKLAQNEAVAREVNQRVDEVAASWYDEGEALEFVCECSYDDCTARVHLSAEEFARVRESPLTFVLVRDHVVPEIERVLAAAGDAVVVEKLGAGRAVADETGS
jgi:hypothetical protein